ncbi:MAG: hypothetical protein ACLPVY_22600 [Acidimicrobiia bacterium]
MAAFNAGVAGLTKMLVPIAALNVRLCNYNNFGELASYAVFRPVPTSEVEVQANGFPTYVLPRGGLGCAKSNPSMLTFASDSQRVTVETFGCGFMVATNGALTVRPTANWLNFGSAP